MNSKLVSVIYAERKLGQQFETLQEGSFQDRALYASIKKSIEDMKNNPACGIKIPKKLWPKTYVRTYDLTNLWKYDLPHGWRLIYTIKQNEIQILNVILEWFDHKSYEKRFNY